MQVCHAIDAVTVVNVHMRHMYTVRIVNNRYGFILIFLLHNGIQFTDNGH